MSYNNKPSYLSPVATATPPFMPERSPFSVSAIMPPNSSATGPGRWSDEEISRKLAHRNAQIGYLEAEYMTLHDRMKEAERKAAAIEVQFANLQQNSHHLTNTSAAVAAETNAPMPCEGSTETIKHFERKIARLNRRIARRDVTIAELRDQLEYQQNNSKSHIILLSPESQNYSTPRTPTVSNHLSSPDGGHLSAAMRNGPSGSRKRFYGQDHSSAENTPRRPSEDPPAAKRLAGNDSRLKLSRPITTDLLQPWAGTLEGLNGTQYQKFMALLRNFRSNEAKYSTKPEIHNMVLAPDGKPMSRQRIKKLKKRAKTA